MTPTKSPVERLLEKSKELRLAAQESTKIDTFYIGHLLTTAVGKDKIIEVLVKGLEKIISQDGGEMLYPQGPRIAKEALNEVNKIAKGVVE